MAYSINKKTNEYARAVPRDLYEAIPKSVWAAIAISSMTCGGDWIDSAERRVIDEWLVLHDNGIVPQPVPAKFRARCTDAHDNPDSY